MKFSSNIILNELDEGLIILNFSNGHYLETNHLGKRIIEMIMDGKTIEIISKTISNEYSVDENVLENDITDYISELKKKNLLDHD